MPIYAFLNDNNKVIKVDALNYNIEAPYVIEISTYDPSLIGKYWDGQNFIVKTETRQRTRLTKLEFRNRFALQELATIYQKIDEGDLTLRIIMDNFNVASYVDVTDPLTQQGIEYLVSIGVLSQERANEILAPIEEVVEV